MSDLLLEPKIEVKSEIKKLDYTNDLFKYFIPPKDKDPSTFPNVRLKSSCIVGYMDTGKTTMELKMMKLIQERVEDRFGINVLNVVANCIVDFVEYFRDNKDKIRLRDYHYINVFIDDVLAALMSYEASQLRFQSERLYSKIRHILNDEFGFRGVLRLTFAGQRYKLVPPFFRSSPLLIFKSIDTHDRQERREVSMLLSAPFYRFLLYVSRRAHFWRDDFLRYAVGKLDNKRFIIDVGEPEKPYMLIEIPFPYTMLKEKEQKEREDLKKAILAIVYVKPDITKREAWRVLRQAGFRFDDAVAIKFFSFAKSRLGVTPQTTNRKP